MPEMEPQINHVKFTLQNLGLNDYQASTLAHLLYLGETKATTLSKASGVPNARIYGILDELSQKGLIIIRPGRPALYSPLSPEEISDALQTLAREEVRQRLSVVDSYCEDFQSYASKMYLKAGQTEKRIPLIRIVSVGDVSLEETKKLYRTAKSKLLISTRAMDYLSEVKTELTEASKKGVNIKILMRSDSSLRPNDLAIRDQNILELRNILKQNYDIRISNEVHIRGCIIDSDNGGKAIFLVEEEGVPFFLREAAITSHPGVVRGLNSLFDLKWRFDSKPINA
jgi:sugar-specific transcriptional regulator TrmB